MDNEDLCPIEGSLIVDMDAELATLAADDGFQKALLATVTRVARGLSAEDVMQEAWIVLVRRLRETHDPARGTVRAHAVGTLTHTVLQARRVVAAQRRPVFNGGPGLRQVPLPDEAELPLVDEAPLADERLDHARQLDRLGKAVERLPRYHRRQLRLDLDEATADLPLTVRAAVAGMSASSYRRSRENTLARLRSELEPGSDRA